MSLPSLQALVLQKLNQLDVGGKRDRPSELEALNADEFVAMYKEVRQVEEPGPLGPLTRHTTAADTYFSERFGDKGFTTPPDFQPDAFAAWEARANRMMRDAKPDWHRDETRSHVIVSTAGANNFLADIAAARLLVLGMRQREPFDRMYFVDPAIHPPLLRGMVNCIRDFEQTIAHKAIILFNFASVLEPRFKLDGRTIPECMDAFVGFNVRFDFTSDNVREGWDATKARIANNAQVFALTGVTNPGKEVVLEDYDHDARVAVLKTHQESK